MQSQTNEVIAEWIREAAGETTTDRRQHGRHSFFRQVTIVGDKAQTTVFTAFSRDLSLKGIGLLHNEPLETGRVSLSIPTPNISTRADHQVDISVDITWCESWGDGWYLSGGRLADLPAVTAASLLVTAALSNLDHRLKQRYPFLRPVTIHIGGASGSNLSAFSRDISHAGIGLLHKGLLETKQQVLTIPRATDRPFDICAHIAWCSPSGDGWYLSGGQFMVAARRRA